MLSLDNKSWEIIGVYFFHSYQNMKCPVNGKIAEFFLLYKPHEVRGQVCFFPFWLHNAGLGAWLIGVFQYIRWMFFNWMRGLKAPIDLLKFEIRRDPRGHFIFSSPMVHSSLNLVVICKSLGHFLYHGNC